MSEAPFRVEIEDQVATVTLSRPDYSNSLTGEFWDQFPIALEKTWDASAVRAIVLAGDGKHFCSGIDTAFISKMVVPPAAEAGRQRVRVFIIGRKMQAVITSIANTPVPVIAAAQGACLGAGLDLFTACDLRYCTADAFFAIQEIQVGVADDIGALQRLPRLIPDGIAREMAFTGRKLTADRAKAFGLVSEVFETTEAMQLAVAKVAKEIAAKSPLAVWGSKQMLNYNYGHTTDDALHHAIMCGAAIFQPDDVLTSIDAMTQRQQPVYDDLIARPKSFADIGR
ncbi:enoyl-CoA hydratase-related protein [Afipia sp. DC4300-2b1]|uniref:enoyl-CoA hydratase-related protein n=1 Tax=Afipia sp. DC4300-2b1 TaxID=2804672 RepID=UPI003CEC7AF9